jgi:chromosome segregation ATPase
MGTKRDNYIEEVKSKIDRWNVEINKFQAKAGKAKAAAQAQLTKELNEIKSKRKVLEEQIAEMQRAGETAWEDVKVGVDLAWQTLGDAIQTAKSRFN